MTSYNPLEIFRLDNRVVLLTGATGYLGAPIARAIAAVGGIPVLCGRNHERLNNLGNELKENGQKNLVLSFDVGNSSACRDQIARIEEHFGKLDGIINCAYGGRPATIEASTDEDFEISWKQNVSGPFAIIQAALPFLKNSAKQHTGGASVINISSMYGLVSPDPRIYGDSGKNNPPFYGAAKAGLIQMTRYLAAHLGPFNIRVNSISPGPFPPPSIKDTQPDFHASLCDKTPLGRIGRAEELVGPVLFLASDASSFVTGTNLAVDGGWTSW